MGDILYNVLIIVSIIIIVEVLNLPDLLKQKIRGTAKKEDLEAKIIKLEERIIKLEKEKT